MLRISRRATETRSRTSDDWSNRRPSADVFERYTETARRVIFFARYEVSQSGGMTIETEHLLLGLLREGGAVVARFVRDATVADLRNEITNRMTVKEKILRWTCRFPMSASVFSRIPPKKPRD